jgi:hypothetical protein
MVIAAAQRDSLVITLEDLELANVMVTDLEKDMPLVFAKIGKTEESNQVDRFIESINRRGAVQYAEAIRMLHSNFPKSNDLEGVLTGAVRAGLIKIDMSGVKPIVIGLRPQIGAQFDPVL